MKLLAVHSFAVHGTASLKAFLSILGTRVLPVPSLYLSGLTNLPGIVKAQVELLPLLESSLDLARLRGDRLVLYVGYLGHPTQVDGILSCLDRYQDLIHAVVVDPVSGDHGRPYVPTEIIEVWPRLLQRADWALPNFTELQLYSGLPPESHAPQVYLDAFAQRFPQLNFVATSLPLPPHLGAYLWHQQQGHTLQHERLPRNYGGSGDVFAAYFFRYYFFEGQPVRQAMQSAIDRIIAILRHSLAEESPDLILRPA